MTSNNSNPSPPVVKILVFPSHQDLSSHNTPTNSTSSQYFPFYHSLRRNLPSDTKAIIYQISDSSSSFNTDTQSAVTTNNHSKPHDVKFISENHLPSLLETLDVLIINMAHLKPSDSDSFRLIRYTLKIIEQSYQNEQQNTWGGKIILLSNCLTWADSLDLSQEEGNEIPTVLEGETDGEQQNDAQENDNQQQNSDTNTPKETTIFSDIEAVCRLPSKFAQTHYQIEKIVARIPQESKGAVKAHVLFSGLWYGREEWALQGPFKTALEQNSVSLQLPLYASKSHPNGDNILPTLHVEDLGKMLAVLVVPPQGASSPPPLYIFAVDSVLHTQKEIMESIAHSFGHAQVQFDIIAHDSPRALLFEYHPYFTLHLNCELNDWMDRTVSKWHSLSDGFVNHIDTIKQEYVETRNLEPLRVVVQGAPFSGKSLCCEALSKYYQVPHLHVKGVLDEYFAQEDTISQQLAEKDIDAQQFLQDYKQQQAKKKGKGSDEPLDQDVEIAALKQKLIELDTLKQDLQETAADAGKGGKKGASKGKGKGAKNAPPAEEDQEEDRGPRYSDRVLQVAFEWKINQLQCKNHGWIMDGFPKTPSQAVELFSLPEEKPVEEESDAKKGKKGKKGAPATEEPEQPKKPRLAHPDRIPHFLFSLHAESDQILLSNLSRIPSSLREEKKSHFSEKAFIRRLQEFNKHQSSHVVQITPKEESEEGEEAPPSEEEKDDVFDTIINLKTTIPVEDEDSSSAVEGETAEEKKMDTVDVGEDKSEGNGEDQTEDKTDDQTDEAPENSSTTTTTSEDTPASEVTSLTITLTTSESDLFHSFRESCKQMCALIGEPHTYEKSHQNMDTLIEETLAQVSIEKATESNGASEQESESEAQQNSSFAETKASLLEEDPQYLTEQKALDEKASELKDYLAANVLPSVTKALIDCCLYRPEDALGYLSDKLLEASAELES